MTTAEGSGSGTRRASRASHTRLSRGDTAGEPALGTGLRAPDMKSTNLFFVPVSRALNVPSELWRFLAAGLWFASEEVLRRFRSRIIAGVMEVVFWNMAGVHEAVSWSSCCAVSMAFPGRRDRMKLAAVVCSGAATPRSGDPQTSVVSARGSDPDSTAFGRGGGRGGTGPGGGRAERRWRAGGGLADGGS